ncbi:MAG: 16S rRNA (guanine(966)-N(2))-methyltransferase RsmD [Gammaproteobacteria bacterium]|nr:16S rRNA (guanine(966)-N(2))-methyltransferase RsmD [Gammaproteobacteria bacterium]
MKAKTGAGTVRIIGGKWRSRRLEVLEQGVRPTSDRVKETLFNWLSPILPGAVCLDLFAGTGALGFEAVSRGASHVDMVDGSHRVIELLKKQATILDAPEVNFYQLNLPDQLNDLPSTVYDIVFMDAPFRQNFLIPCCQWLEQTKRLASNAYIYIEMEKELAPLSVPATWEIWRNNLAGQVAYCLYKKTRLSNSS